MRLTTSGRDKGSEPTTAASSLDGWRGLLSAELTFLPEVWAAALSMWCLLQHVRSCPQPERCVPGDRGPEEITNWLTQIGRQAERGCLSSCHESVGGRALQEICRRHQRPRDPSLVLVHSAKIRNLLLRVG